MLDAKARKWLHPGLGGATKTKAPREGPSRAEILAGMRAGFDPAALTQGLNLARELQPLQQRVLDFLLSAASAPAGGDVDFEAALATLGPCSLADVVQLWVREAGLAFALQALWRRTTLFQEYRPGTPAPFYTLRETEKDSVSAPGDGWWMLRRLAAAATPEARAAAVAAGARLLDGGSSMLDGFVALVLPEPAWVQRAATNRQWWSWSLVLTAPQAEQVLATCGAHAVGRSLLVAHAADLADRLGEAAAPILGRFLAALAQDLAAHALGNHELELAVARVVHLLGCIDSDEATLWLSRQLVSGHGLIEPWLRARPARARWALAQLQHEPAPLGPAAAALLATF